MARCGFDAAGPVSGGRAVAHLNLMEIFAGSRSVYAGPRRTGDGRRSGWSPPPCVDRGHDCPSKQRYCEWGIAGRELRSASQRAPGAAPPTALSRRPITGQRTPADHLVDVNRPGGTVGMPIVPPGRRIGEPTTVAGWAAVHWTGRALWQWKERQGNPWSPRSTDPRGIAQKRLVSWSRWSKPRTPPACGRT